MGRKRIENDEDDIDKCSPSLCISIHLTEYKNLTCSCSIDVDLSGVYELYEAYERGKKLVR